MQVYLYVHECMHMHVCHSMHVEIRDNLQESILFIYHVSFRDGI